MDIVNCSKFRVSVYQEHKVTGLPPTRELRYTHYLSGDGGGRQWNHSLKIGLTTCHLKWRSNAELTETPQGRAPARDGR